MSAELIRKVAQIYNVDISRVPHEKVAALVRKGMIRAAVALIRRWARAIEQPSPDAAWAGEHPGAGFSPVSDSVVAFWRDALRFKIEYAGKIPAHT